MAGRRRSERGADAADREHAAAELLERDAAPADLEHQQRRAEAARDGRRDGELERWRAVLRTVRIGRIEQPLHVTVEADVQRADQRAERDDASIADLIVALAILAVADAHQHGAGA